MLAIFLILAALSLLTRIPQPQPASFDLNDPQAARAKYAELAAIDGWTAQGQAWCALTPAEIRAIAQHTDMSNTITTTIHITSDGETTTSVIVQPAPNHDELVERAVQSIADSCRLNLWDNVESLSNAADDAARAEVFCAMPPQEAEMFIRFSMDITTSISKKIIRDTGESVETTISNPPEPPDEAKIAAAIAAFSAQCEPDRP